jgi:hypothetical protein
MHPRVLSSAQTLLMKAVFPAFWIGMFGIGTLMMWFGTQRSSAEGGLPAFAPWLMGLVWLAGSAFLLRFCARLKRVRADDEFLYLSNYLREVRVPLKSIDAVTEIRWINIHPVTVHFRVPTAFGRSITFMPRVRVFGQGSHPVVDELRGAAGLPLASHRP